MFTAALFTIAKIRKQPECPLTDKWIKKMRYTHTMECYLAIKKKEIMPSAATWTDLKFTTLSEVRNRKTNTIQTEVLYQVSPSLCDLPFTSP